jgi:hypothetical protein
MNILGTDQISMCSSKYNPNFHKSINETELFLISNFHHVLNVVCFLLGDSLASEVYMPTFWNTVSVRTYSPMKMEQTECSEILEFKLQTPVNHSEESIQQNRTNYLPN